MGLIAEGVYLGSEINSGSVRGTYRCSHKIVELPTSNATFATGGYTIVLDTPTLNIVDMLISADNYSSFAFQYLLINDNGAGKAQIAEVSHILNNTTIVIKTPMLFDSDSPAVYLICPSTLPPSLLIAPVSAELSKPIKKAIVKATDPAAGAALTIVANGNIQQDMGFIYYDPYIIENPGGIVPFAISDAANFNLITQF